MSNKTLRRAPHNGHLADKRPDLCVFIGRFSPLHMGHEAVIREGLAAGKHMVVLVGSAFEPRSFRNPFTVAERMAHICAAFDNNPRLIVRPLENSAYNLNEWIERVYTTVEDVWKDIGGESKPSVALIGHSKDASSYYLNLFPLWQSINVPLQQNLSATFVREQVFGTHALVTDLLDQIEQDEKLTGERTPTPQYIARYIERAREQALAYLQRPSELSERVRLALVAFVHTSAYEQVATEYAFVAKYRYSWRFAPYEPTFVTADAVVVQSGHVLMVKRKGFPGKGLWALPGGFVEKNDTIEQTWLKELKEETAVRVPDAVLRGHVKAKEVFDDPHRSSRGRTITHAFLIHLDPGPLPKTKRGGQEGDEETFSIQWKALSDLRRDETFEDHYSIITNLSKRI